MTEVNDFNPDWVSPPGDTIADILARRHLSTREFAQQLGRTEHYAAELLCGSAEIDKEIAECLTTVLGASSTFWLNRERLYRRAVARLESNSDAALRDKWLDVLPLSDMKRYGWLDFVSGTPDSGVQCLRFFGVDSVEAFTRRCDELLKLANFRTSQVYRSDPAAVAAWLRQGELEAGKIQCKAWNAEALRAQLPVLRKLTRIESVDKFFPVLRQVCAACGVAVSVVRAPAKCRASGASWVLPEGTRALVLTTRYRTDDQFWFTFFHEVGHLILHPDQTLIIDEFEDEDGKEQSEQENEANDFAAKVLIPEQYQRQMLSLPVDARRVMRFAKDLGIAPGIVVGQLQHFRRFTHKQLNFLRKPLEWDRLE